MSLWGTKRKYVKFGGDEDGSIGYHLGLSGEGWGLRGGGVRGTAALGAMEAAGIKPGAICFYRTQSNTRISPHIMVKEATSGELPEMRKK